jgi:hypothetical protein
VTVSANASASAGLNPTNPVLFFLDGTTNQLPGPVTANGTLFSISWDTTRAANGTHSISAVATDVNNLQTTATVSGLTVSNPAPPMGCFIVDRTIAAHGRGPVTTPATGFNTALPGERLLAFVGSDGPSNNTQTATVSGSGLTWTLVKRANTQHGTAEIWTAIAPTALTNATFTANQSRTGYDMSIYVIAVQNSSGIGTSVTASAPSGAPTLTLTTTKAGSLLYATGNDWETRKPGL